MILLSDSVLSAPGVTSASGVAAAAEDMKVTDVSHPAGGTHPLCCDPRTDGIHRQELNPNKNRTDPEGRKHQNHIRTRSVRRMIKDNRRRGTVEHGVRGSAD